MSERMISSKRQADPHPGASVRVANERSQSDSAARYLVQLQRTAGNRSVAAMLIQRQTTPGGNGLDEALELRPTQHPIELGPQGIRPPRNRSLREEYGVLGTPPHVSNAELRRMSLQQLKQLAERVQSGGGGTEIYPALVQILQAAQRLPGYDVFDSVWAMQDDWIAGAARYREYLRLARVPHEEISMTGTSVRPQPRPGDMLGTPNVPYLDTPTNIVPSAVDTPGFVGGIATVADGFLGLAALGEIASPAYMPALEIAGLIFDIVSTLIALPVVWLQTDSVNRFNGCIEGYALAMQDMANRYRNPALDQIPYERWNEFPSLVRPPVPSRFPPAYHQGLDDGNQRAFNQINSYSRVIAVPLRGGGTRQVTISGPQLMRAWYRRTNGFVASEIMREVNRQLRAAGKPPWPVPPSALSPPAL